ncbi:response regulator [Novosphingobium sp. AP12]|uniref:response regulator n=1 Tax=Novosphingobium sp. AP12 TaxID=1144305 RepID=UPI0009DB4DB7|nr:response regulator [Novosphingobium sp. AP12]
MEPRVSDRSDASGQIEDTLQGSPGRVLVIDDDAEMRDAIISYLSSHNCAAEGLVDPSNLSQQLASVPYSLVILDIQLGAHDGFDVLRKLRERSDVPVIIITGQRQDEIDRIVGLELGADDYLLKPFNLRELLARARAILRRQEIGRTRSNRKRDRGIYRFAGWELRRWTHSLVDPRGDAVALTKSEYALLIAFLESPGRILSREHLLQATRTHDDVFDRSIDVQVLRLRRKLETDPAQPRLIRTERGAGYIFDATVERLF